MTGFAVSAIADPIAGIRASGPLPLMSAVAQGLPLSSLDRVVRSVAPSDTKFSHRISPRAARRGRHPGPPAKWFGCVSAQTLDRILTAYRIGDPAGAYPIFDSTGSKLWPGRWNTNASPMIYTSQHYSTAMLEKLVHGNGQMPPNQHRIEITIPPGVPYEILSTAHHPGWETEDCLVSKAFGEA